MVLRPRAQANIAGLRRLAREAQQQGNVRRASLAHQEAKQLLAREFEATRAVERAITDTLYEYEQARTGATGPLFISGYLRRALKGGLIAAVDRLVGRKQTTDGFEKMLQMGRPEIAFESVVVKHPRTFSATTVQRAQARLHSSARYWWVNHKQTYKQGVSGGYLWSPKRNSNGAQNRTYDNMTRIQPGEVVFSYASGAIRAIGHAVSLATSAKKPSEFGSAGKAWSKHDGWKVQVQFTELAQPFRPAALHMRELAPLLPPTHSPIRPDGKGNQGVYLAEIPPALAAALQRLMHEPAKPSPQRKRESPTERENKELSVVDRIEKDHRIPETTKRYLLAARIGQGLFRQRLEAIEAACRITGITDRRFLRASHIRPWRHSTNQQRLDGHNGLLLAAHIDQLFDGGYISFEDDGTLIVSRLCPPEVLVALGVPVSRKVGPFRPQQQEYLRYHRQHVFSGRLRKVRGTGARGTRSSPR